MNTEKGFVKYIVIIIVILAIVFLSQQPYFRELGKSLFVKGSSAVQGYTAKGANWVDTNILPKVTGEVANGGDAIKNKVAQEKQNVSQSIGDKIKNYFSGVVDSVFNPGKKTDSIQNCTTPTQAPVQAASNPLFK